MNGRITGSRVVVSLSGKELLTLLALVSGLGVSLFRFEARLTNLDLRLAGIERAVGSQAVRSLPLAPSPPAAGAAEVSP